MKRHVYRILSILLLLGLSACGTQNLEFPTVPSDTSSPPSEESAESSSDDSGLPTTFYRINDYSGTGQ